MADIGLGRACHASLRTVRRPLAGTRRVLMTSLRATPGDTTNGRQTTDIGPLARVQ